MSPYLLLEEDVEEGASFVISAAEEMVLEYGAVFAPSIMALNALMRSVFPAESEESHSPRTLTFILHCRASLCHTITLTASLGVPCNTSRLHFNCNSLPCSNTTTAEF